MRNDEALQAIVNTTTVNIRLLHNYEPHQSYVSPLKTDMYMYMYIYFI